MKWNDNRISWDPKDWNGIQSINIDANQLWVPDIVPYNGEQIRANSITFVDNLPKVTYFKFKSVGILKFFSFRLLFFMMGKFSLFLHLPNAHFVLSKVKIYIQIPSIVPLVMVAGHITWVL